VPSGPKRSRGELAVLMVASSLVTAWGLDKVRC
jgi:hypothetical protein